jgi:hypothetical protein
MNGRQRIAHGAFGREDRAAIDDHARSRASRHKQIREARHADPQISAAVARPPLMQVAPIASGHLHGRKIVRRLEARREHDDIDLVQLTVGGDNAAPLDVRNPVASHFA